MSDRTASSVTTTSSAVRIGDAERERVASVLNAHVGAGRLDLAEFEQRVAAAYAARTRGELDLVTADLPAPSHSAAPRSQRQDRRPDHRALLRWAAWGPLVATGVICMVVWALTSLAAGQALYFWPMWVVGPWGAAMLFGGAATSMVPGGRCPLSFHGAPRGR